MLWRIRALFGGLATGTMCWALAAGGCGGEGEVDSGATGPSGGTGANTNTGGDGGAGGLTSAAGGSMGVGAGSAQGGSNGGSNGSAAGGQGGTSAGGNASGGSSGSSGGLGDPCTWGSTPCDMDLYCDASGCGTGTCQPITNTASQQQIYDPVCGCDGINYYNPTIASSHGAAIAHADVCTTGEEVACDTMSNPCGAGQSCSVEVANQGVCAPNLTAGVCWAAPISCATGAPQARGCIPPNTCANKCALVRSQNGWYDDGTCP